MPHEEISAAPLEAPQRVGGLDLHDDVTPECGIELRVGVLRRVQEDRIDRASGLFYARDTEIEIHGC